MTTKKFFESMRELLTPENRWTQGNYAKNEFGANVGPISPYAVCWCLLGAYAKIKENCIKSGEIIPIGVLGLINKEIDNVGLTIFNDTHTHQEVLEMLDSIIGQCGVGGINII